MNHKDYSYINNLDDLKREIQVVKFRAMENKVRLEQKWTRLPSETLKKVGTSITNRIFHRSIATTSSGLVKTAVSILVPRKDANVRNVAGKLGVYAAIGGLLMWLKKKRK